MTEESRCSIYANAFLSAPYEGISYHYDWSAQSYLDRDFLELGYEGMGSASLEDMRDGDLYSHVVTTQGSKPNYWTSRSLIFSYTIIEIRKKNSQEKNGYTLVTRGSSSKSAAFKETIEDSLGTSYNQALRSLKSCRRIMIDEKNKKKL